MQLTNFTNHFRSISEHCQNTNFSGNISIIKNKEIVYSRSTGYSDISNRIKINSKTAFGIASGTKTITAVAVLKLIEANQLHLESTINEIFDEELTFIHPKATIKNLLTHTSGIFDYYDEELANDFNTFEVEIPWYKLETPSDYFPLFHGKKIKYVPNERISYSNGGYVFLGMIIEKISGMLYRDFVNEYIFKPAEMNHSGFFAFNALPPNTASGYISTDNEAKTNIYQLPIRGGADGGAYTNSEDIHKFWDALFKNDLLPESIRRVMIQEHVDIYQHHKYGLGVYLSMFGNKLCLKAIGADAGVGFNSMYVPDEDLNINIFSNTTNGNKSVNTIVFKKCEEIF